MQERVYLVLLLALPVFGLAAQLPAAQSSAVQLPAAQSPAAQLPAVQSPAVQSPAVQSPAAQSPAAQSPAAQLPAVPTGAAEAVLLLATLSLREKVGQLFMSWILSASAGQAEQRATMQRYIRDVGLGGVILSLGSVQEAAELVTELQASTKVPLLLASDFEGGVAARLSGACAMGNQMLVGATGLPRLARAMGEITGDEATAIGIPWVFAPVLDINSNPQNPIINVRSFGADPASVALFGCAFAQGVRSRGAVPCGKHFPGHGDVQSDSHLALPTVAGNGARLRSVELLPFRAAIEQGLESIMTGHLSVPGLLEDPSIPATLSNKILVEVLRKELGFRGLIVTDALDMGGVKNKLDPSEVAVRALLAGADVLLMPPDPIGARDAVVNAVESGRIPMARLDDAVLRILQLKGRLLLLQKGVHGPVADWQQRINNKHGQLVANEIARRGITLVRDPLGLVPIAQGLAISVVTLRFAQAAAGSADAVAEQTLATAMRAAKIEVADAVTAHLDAAELSRASEVVQQARRLVIALHVPVREYSGTIGLPPMFLELLAKIRPNTEVIYVSFGSPYVVQQLDPLASFICAYASSVELERAVAGALTDTAITGRLPVPIPGIAALSAGRTRLPGMEIGQVSLANEGLDAGFADSLHGLLVAGVAEHAFPGAVCLVARHGRVVATVVEGKVSYAENASLVRADTLYDIASLTKVCATLPVVLRLAQQSKLSLDDPVQTWLTGFDGDQKEHVTIRHLLAHTSGLPSFRQYYKTLRGKDAVLNAALREPLESAPGTKVVYSDIGLMLAMAVIEAAGSAPFAQQVKELVWAPLGMTGACFNTNADAPLESPPTEVSSDRGGLIQGYVHDENAFAMGGVSGHAGMFATAQDVLRLGVWLLADGRGLLPAPLVVAALQPQSQVGSTRALGFDLLTDGSFGGTKVPPGTFGHTGFTGTSLWCDPVHDVCVVLLTNRVHPTRDNDKIGGIRRRLHDLVLDAMGR